MIAQKYDRTFNILAEIAECFERQGLVFTFTTENDKYVGQTTPTSSGAYIKINQYVGDDYIIELLNEAKPDSYDQRARGAVHQHVMMALIYNRRSPDSAHFLRQDLLALKKIGIEQVVASLIALHKQYDEIWTVLETHNIQRQVAALLELFADNSNDILESIDVVIGENFPIPQ